MSPPLNDSPVVLRKHCAAMNARLAQMLGETPAWGAGGVRWLVQRFYYHLDAGQGHRMCMHRHNWLELTLVDRGTATYSTPESSRTLVPGDVFFMSPGGMHEWRVASPPLVLMSLQLRATAISVDGERLLQELAVKVRAGEFFLRRPRPMGKLHREIRRLLDEPPTPLLGEKLEAMLRLFIAEFLELTLRESLPPLPPVAEGGGQTVESRNEQIIEFVRNNLHQPIRLEDVAKHFHYSVRQISRQFYKENGVALGHYIVEQKLRHAQQLLATSERSVKDIALSLGYGSASYFCRLFHDYTNTSPSDYRTLAHAQRLRG